MSTQPSTYVHANPNALSVPTNIQEIPAWAQEIKNLLLAMNQNLSLVIGQAAAHHTDIGTTQATLNNHDSSITNLDALIVKLGADIAKIGTAAASGSSIALATKAPKLATPDKFDGISYPGSTAHEWLEPYLEEDVVKGNPVLGSTIWMPSGCNSMHAGMSKIGQRTSAPSCAPSNKPKGVQDYYKDFQTYSQGLGYNDPSLRDMFYDGLSHKIKETLMVQDYDHADASVTLATLAEKALKVDQRLEQFAAQHKGSPPLQTNLEANPAPLRQQQPRERPGINCLLGNRCMQLWMERLRRGSSKNWPNAKGIAVPIVKWNDGTTMDVTFKTIKKDNHPVTATSTPAPKASSSSSCATLVLHQWT
ncbi:hypothetical protein RHS01_08652 [Rhizoctonia solani]|uniref:Uncharacterized protein n=1 Tax=Rhizoctonia solani TaxID=456999 RepID=A0A8H7IA99_9AGAM|nr:hypothetical protein RHS01_08652 [Rhizoctonia solani]